MRQCGNCGKRSFLFEHGYVTLFALLLCLILRLDSFLRSTGGPYFSLYHGLLLLLIRYSDPECMVFDVAPYLFGAFLSQRVPRPDFTVLYHL